MAELGAVERGLAGKRRRFREFVQTQTVEWSGADRLVRWLHDHALRWFFRPWVAGPSLVVSIAGVVAFVALVRSQRFDLSGRSLLVGFVLLLVLNYFLTFVHELGHALVLVANGRRIRSAGFQLYFGSPAWFVDCSDGLMMDRRHRMLSAAAGPYAAAHFGQRFPRIGDVHQPEGAQHDVERVGVEQQILGIHTLECDMLQPS